MSDDSKPREKGNGMSLTRYTPGPWTVDPDHGADAPVYAGVDCVATVWLAPETVANARLIAAAPDLYEAAEDLSEHVVMGRDFFRKSGSWDAYEDRAVNQLLAAIAKVRGIEFEPDCHHDLPAWNEMGICECGTIMRDQYGDALIPFEE